MEEVNLVMVLEASRQTCAKKVNRTQFITIETYSGNQEICAVPCE